MILHKIYELFWIVSSIKYGREYCILNILYVLA